MKSDHIQLENHVEEQSDNSLNFLLCDELWNAIEQNIHDQSSLHS